MAKAKTHGNGFVCRASLTLLTAKGWVCRAVCIYRAPLSLFAVKLFFAVRFSVICRVACLCRVFCQFFAVCLCVAVRFPAVTRQRRLYRAATHGKENVDGNAGFSRSESSRQADRHKSMAHQKTKC
jgi:hypothetical protein